MTETNLKLALISEVMADAYYFVHLRTIVESWEKEAEAGNELASDAMTMITQFYNLCRIVKDNS